MNNNKLYIILYALFMAGTQAVYASQKDQEIQPHEVILPPDGPDQWRLDSSEVARMLDIARRQELPPVGLAATASLGVTTAGAFMAAHQARPNTQSSGGPSGLVFNNDGQDAKIAHGAQSADDHKSQSNFNGLTEEGRKLQKEIWEAALEKALQSLAQDKNNINKAEIVCNIIKKKYFFDEDEASAQVALTQVLSIAGNAHLEAIEALTVFFEYIDKKERINMLKSDWELDKKKALEAIRKTCIAQREIRDLCYLINHNDQAEGAEEEVLQKAYRSILSHLDLVAKYSLEINNICNRYNIGSFSNWLRNKRLQLFTDARREVKGASQSDQIMKTDEYVNTRMDKIVFADEIEKLITYQNFVLTTESNLKKRISDIAFTLSTRFDAQGRNLYIQAIKDLIKNLRAAQDLLGNIKWEFESIPAFSLDEKLNAHARAQDYYEKIKALDEISKKYLVEDIFAGNGIPWAEISGEIDNIIVLKQRINYVAKSAEEVMGKLVICIQETSLKEREEPKGKGAALEPKQLDDAKLAG
jgi:hypothetical protein